MLLFFPSPTGSNSLLKQFWRPLRNQRVHLNCEADLQAFDDPQLDHAVEERFPMAIAREIVVADEEPPVALPVVFPNRVLDIVGSSETGSCGPVR
jgi:hypothetical protein